MLPVNQTLEIDQCNCFAMRKANRQISRFYDAHLEPVGLRITQFLTLAALNEVGSAAINPLAEWLDIERTAMGKMVGFLERAAWSESGPPPPMAVSALSNSPKQAAVYTTKRPLFGMKPNDNSSS